MHDSSAPHAIKQWKRQGFWKQTHLHLIGNKAKNDFGLVLAGKVTDGPQEGIKVPLHFTHVL